MKNSWWKPFLRIFSDEEGDPHQSSGCGNVARWLLNQFLNINEEGVKLSMGEHQPIARIRSGFCSEMASFRNNIKVSDTLLCTRKT